MNKSYVLRVGRLSSGKFFFEIADGLFYGAGIHRSSTEETLADAASKGAIALLQRLRHGEDFEDDDAKFTARVEDAVRSNEEAPRSFDQILDHALGSHPQPSRMKFFEVRDQFQDDFDRWVAKVEEESGGVLEIVREEPVVKDGSTAGFMIWYRVGEPGYDADAPAEDSSKFNSRYDDEMPKVDPGAKRIKEFMLGDNFQAEFDAWAAEIEKEHGGSLEITHEEIIHDGVKIRIFWRIVHGPHAAKGRR